MKKKKKTTTKNEPAQPVKISNVKVGLLLRRHQLTATHSEYFEREISATLHPALPPAEYFQGHRPKSPLERHLLGSSN